MTNLPIIDAHQHFWDLTRNYHPWLRDKPMVPFRYGDYAMLRKNYLPDDYHRDARSHNIVKTVYVETEWDPNDPVGETRWVHEINQRFGIPNAVVAQAWLDRHDIAEVLAAQAEYPLVRSVRHKPRAAVTAQQVRPGASGSMRDPKWRAGYALLSQYGLSFDLQTPYWHLVDALELAQTFPDTQIIVNHTGLPADRSLQGLHDWYAAMQNLAHAGNVVVKISGLGVAGQPWTVQNNQTIVLNTIELFGVDRCMFASNFPVDSLVADFDTIYSGFKQIVKDFSQQEQQKLFHDNALRVYRIKP